MKTIEERLIEIEAKLDVILARLNGAVNNDQICYGLERSRLEMAQTFH